VVSFPHVFPPKFCKHHPDPRQVFTFRNEARFYDWQLLAPRSTAKLDDHPRRLSATAYSIY
jgi:hypothetical protein